MRQKLQGTSNWVEVTDHNQNDEFEDLVTAVKGLKAELYGIKDELQMIYCLLSDRKEEVMYIEGGREIRTAKQKVD
jgi:hypothetical protein